jgi:putative ABC transport system permease protein
VRLLQFPGVAVAVLAAALVLALTVTSGRLFLAAAGDAAVAQELERVGGVPALALVAFGGDPAAVAAVQAEAESVARIDAPGLGPPVRTRLGPALDVVAGARATGVRFAARDGFEAHIEVLDRAAGGGAWLTDEAARSLGVRAGQTVRLGGPVGVEVEVAGVYRDLAAGDRPLDPFWSPLASSIYDLSVARNPPPPLLLVDPDRFDDLAARLGEPARQEWDFYPEPGRLTLPRAERLAAQVRVVESAAGDPLQTLGQHRVTTSSPLAAAVGRAHATVAALTGPVESISLTGRLLAMVLVAAAAAFAVRRRRAEVLLLTAQGVGGLPIGARSMVEAVLPLATGGALGYLAALGLAGALNPVPGLQPDAVAAARLEVAAALLTGLVLFGLVTWVAVRSEELERSGRLGHALAGPWWELLVLVLAAAALYELQTRGAGPVQLEGQPARVDRLLVLFPLLLIAGLAGLATRGAARLLTRRGRPGLTAAAAARPAPLLALRRLVAAPRMVLLLVTGSAVALGLLAYSGIVVASTRSAAAGKARVLVGSDTSLLLGDQAPPGATAGLRATVVRRVEQVTLTLDDRPAGMIAVDPATFARGAVWDDGFADASLDELLRRLEAAPPDRLGAVLAGPGGADARSVDVGPARLPLTVVATARAFPGMTSAARPLLVVSAARLDAIAEREGFTVGSRTELWARDDPAVAVAAVRRAGVAPETVTTAAAVMRTPAFLAVSWTFRLLEALGGLAGVVALAGLVLYAQARQRGRVVAYALTRRMGLSRAAHRRSVLYELAGMLLFALALGAGLAVVAAGVVYRSLDPMPQLPPAPGLALPGALLGATLLGVLLAAAAGAFLVQRAADRAKVAEVMRLAG